MAADLTQGSALRHLGAAFRVDRQCDATPGLLSIRTTGDALLGRAGSPLAPVRPGGRQWQPSRRGAWCPT